VENLTAKYPDKFAFSKIRQEVEKNFKKGLISFPMGWRNDLPVESNSGEFKAF
jgi:membrane dipeptidase